MLNNYKLHKNGLIQQIYKGIFLYNEQYVVKSYDTYDTVQNISFLRLGYIVGSIGHIPQSILDFGYGNGGFLKACTTIKERSGYDLTGYKLPSDIKLYNSISDVFSNNYQVVTFFDSLQHIHNPVQILENLKCDYVVISVPNCHYFDDNWFLSWKHRRQNQHVWHFSEQALINFMNQIGYDVVNITNLQDNIRINNQNYSNIITAIFSKRRHL